MRVALIPMSDSPLTMVGGFTTDPQQLKFNFGYSVEATIVSPGAVAGTLKLQGSVNHVEDDQGNVVQAGEWVDIKGSSLALTDDEPTLYNVSDVMYPYIRAVWTDSGSDADAKMTLYLYYRGF